MASSTPEHIHVGQDGWLFLKTGTNDVLGQYERPEETTELVWQWRSLVATRASGHRWVTSSAMRSTPGPDEAMEFAVPHCGQA